MGGSATRKGVFALLLWAAGVLVLLLCSFNTTPLNPFYGGDGHFFALMGRMTAQGYLPFADVYDQKGPLVFYINALGWLILPGKGGMFLVQSLFLVASLGLVYGLCRLWGTVRQSLAGLGVFVAVYAACLWGGNMTEEYSLPLCLLPAYLILRHFARGGTLATLPPRPLMLAGVCLGLLAFLRLNNAAPLCGVLLGLAFCVRDARGLVRLFILAYSAVAGLVAAVVPVCLFFHYQGALDDMLTGTFIHNWRYAMGHTAERGLVDSLLVAAHASSILLLAWVLFRVRKKAAEPMPDADRLLLAFAAFSALVPAMGPASSHYFIMAAPAIALTFVYFAGKAGRNLPGRLFFAGLLLLPFAWDAAHLAAGFRRYNIIWDYQADIDAARAIASHIPAGDRVLAYDVHASIYTYGGLTPCHRYFTMQGEMAKFNPDIAPAIQRLMETEPPTWLILPHSATPSHPAIQNALQNGSYSLRFSGAGSLHLDLWRLER